MYTDAQARFSLAQSVATTGTVVSTNTEDLLSANRDISRGQENRLIVTVDTTLVGGTSIQAQYIQSANANMSSPDVIGAGPVIPVASAAAGAVVWDTPVPSNTKRYVALQYVLVGTFTAGNVSAHYVANTDYPARSIPMYTGY